MSYSAPGSWLVENTCALSGRVVTNSDFSRHGHNLNSRTWRAATQAFRREVIEKVSIEENRFGFGGDRRQGRSLRCGSMRLASLRGQNLRGRQEDHWRMEIGTLVHRQVSRARSELNDHRLLLEYSSDGRVEPARARRNSSFRARSSPTSRSARTPDGAGSVVTAGDVPPI